MGMFLLMPASLIPAVLLVLAATLAVRRGPPASAGKRLIFVLLATGVLLLAALPFSVFIFGISQIATSVQYLFLPAVIGLLLLILLNIRVLGRLRRSEQLLAALLTAANLALILAGWPNLAGVSFLLLACSLPAAVAWLAGHSSARAAIILGTIGLLLLALLNVAMNTAFAQNAYERSAIWLSYSFGILMFALPGLTISLAAVLLDAGLRLLTVGRANPNAEWALRRRPALLCLGLAALLLAYLVYTTMWISVWDQTSDGISGINYAMLSAIAAVASGVVLFVHNPRRIPGLIFALAVPALMTGAFFTGLALPYHALTDERAAHIQGAVERFHTRTGRYPAQLTELVPRELLFVPRPVILQGQSWCYQGGPDYYRFGVYTRDNFSTPLSLRVYASAGQPPEADWTCGARIAEIKARYDPPPH
jgi:hypothetical protein